jgi:hypothetical protein
MQLTTRIAVVTTALLLAHRAGGEPVPVRHHEGETHGFLVLRAMDGTALADGDLTQVTRGDEVTTRLAFHFKDGSVHDETAVFSQRQHFRLLRDHLVQKGPSFPQPLDLTLDAATGQATVSYTDKGRDRVAAKRLSLPTDVANGIIQTLLKNVAADSTPITLSLVAATPTPRLVTLEISEAGRNAFTIAGAKREATHYVVKVKIGGIAGLLAPLVGKQPADSHVWILGGTAPAFVKSEGPLYFGGPSWRIELASPVWPAAASTGN